MLKQVQHDESVIPNLIRELLTKTQTKTTTPNRQTTNKMKKLIATLSFIFAFTFMSNAQIFLIDDEIDNPRIPSDEFVIDNPGWHGSGEDWYTPVGDGALLLAALGGAYLFGKRRKENK